jgi:hypothetical protein
VSTDLDDLLRTTMRRHADDAPTRVDLDAVRTRSHAITRRRRFEAATAVITTLVLLLGAGYAASRLRTEATPIEPVPSGSAWTSFFRFDGNAAEQRFARLILHTAAGEKEIASAFRSAEVVGWYGAEHRTLVFTEGTDVSVQSPLMSITLAADGTVTAPAAPLRLPTYPSLSGIAYPITTGFAVWHQTADNPRQGELVVVDDALTDAVVAPLPQGRAIFVTPTTVALGMPDRTTIELYEYTQGRSTSVAGCSPMVTSAVAPDGVHAAVACGDGSVVLVNLSSRTSFRTQAIPGGAAADPASSDPSGAILSLWYDPAIGLHASMTPSAYAGFTDVRDYGWNGVGWDAEGTGVLTRVFPEGSSPLRLERLAKDGVEHDNAGRWIVERPHDVDLGYAIGTVAVRPAPTSTPSPSPSQSAQALPPAPATAPWTAWLRPVAGAAPSAVDVVLTLAGRDTPVTTVENAQVAIAGWTGPGRRTLVWGATQDYPGDQVIETASFTTDGAVASGPRRLTAPDGSELLGRPFVLADGSLAVWRYLPGRSPQPQGELLRFSADLATATTQALPVGNAVFVTRDAIGLQDEPRAPSTLTVVSKDSTGSLELPTCRTGFGASVDPLGSFAAISCGGTEVDVVAVPTAAQGVAGAVTPLGRFPSEAGLLATWFDADSSVHASSRAADGSIASWVWDSQRGARGEWVLAATQSVATATYVDGYAVQLVLEPGRGIEGRWTTGTSPALELTPTTQFPTLTGGAAARPSS